MTADPIEAAFHKSSQPSRRVRHNLTNAFDTQTCAALVTADGTRLPRHNYLLPLQAHT